METTDGNILVIRSQCPLRPLSVSVSNEHKFVYRKTTSESMELASKLKKAQNQSWQRPHKHVVSVVALIAAV